MKLEVQLTPTHSACSIAFGKGVTAGEPGSVQRLMLAVDDIDAARADLISRGAEVGEFSTWRADVFPALTRKVRPTRPMPRSAIPMATGGSSKRDGRISLRLWRSAWPGRCRRASRPPGGTRTVASCVAGSSPQCAASARRRCG
jgi:hypothetical protein